jgi:methyl-accepting chemotaxis protein
MIKLNLTSLTIRSKFVLLGAGSFAGLVLIGAAYLFGQNAATLALERRQHLETLIDAISETQLRLGELASAVQRLSIERTSIAAKAISPRIGSVNEGLDQIDMHATHVSTSNAARDIRTAFKSYVSALETAKSLQEEFGFVDQLHATVAKGSVVVEPSGLVADLSRTFALMSSLVDVEREFDDNPAIRQIELSLARISEASAKLIAFGVSEYEEAIDVQVGHLRKLLSTSALSGSFKSQFSPSIENYERAIHSWTKKQRESEKVERALAGAFQAVRHSTAVVTKQAKDQLIDAERKFAKARWLANAFVVGTIIGSLAFLVAVGGLIATDLWRMLRQLVLEVSELAAGKTDLRITGADRGDEVGAMARAMVVFRDAAINKSRLEKEAEAQRRLVEEADRQAQAERLKNQELLDKIASQQAILIEELGLALGRLSRGDLAVRLESTPDDDFHQIKTDFNRMAEAVGAIATRINEASGMVESSTREIATGVADLSDRTEQQAAALEETSASLEQLSVTVRHNANNAQLASQEAVAACDLAMDGSSIADRAIDAMRNIEGSSRQITDIVALIESIAFQTNILALNAAVEAARVGETGRGFAVVANEVRALAQRSSQALKEIKIQIASSSDNVVHGVELVTQAGAALKDVNASIIKAASLVSEIAAASKEQASGIEQVSKAVSSMEQITQQNAALVEETNASLHAAHSQVEELGEVVALFNTGQQNSNPTKISSAQVSAAESSSQMGELQSRPTKRLVGGRVRGAATSAIADSRDIKWQVF